MKQLLVFVMLMFSHASFSQAGTPDNTFDGDGKLQVAVAGGMYNPASLPRSVVLQPDGKILTCGAIFNGTNYDIIIFRFNSNGTPDNSFDGDGRVITSHAFNDYAFRLALQTDGKIVAVGYTTPDATTNNWNMIVLRYNTDGSPDNSFDTDGKVIANVSGASDFAFAVAIQTDGKIIAGGCNDIITTAGNSTLLRLNTDGTPDNTFSGDGIASLTAFSTRDYIYDLKLQPDGKIVCMSFNQYQTGPDRYQAVISRFNSDGTLDNSFDTDGFTTLGPFAFPYFDVRLYGITVQSDGKITGAGAVLDANNGSLPAPFIARFNSDGSPDNGFGVNGSRIPGTGVVSAFFDVLQQPDGKILTTGRYNDNSYYVRRFNDNGSDDLGFNGTGFNSFNITPVVTDNEFGQGIALQTDGNIVVTGLVEQVTPGLYDLGMIRVLGSDGTLPVTLLNFTAFKQGGKTLLHWQTATEQNNNGFEIQRSINGRNFSSIGFVNGAGNSSAITHYSFTDITPYKGINYYRLKQIDMDGNSKLSEVRRLNFDEAISISVYPNPVASVLNIQLSDKATRVSITDMQGRMIWQQAAGNSLSFLVPVEKLPAGTYFIYVAGIEGSRQVAPFVKE